MSRLTFLGGAGEVTGSCYLLETSHSRLLLECGMFQGGDDDDTRNRRKFTFDPKQIDAVVVSHAHLDHSGLLPRLAQSGYAGPIYVTPATHELLDVMLKDAAFLAERDAEWENKSRRRADRPLVAPLYTIADAESAVALCRPAPYHQKVDVCRDIQLRFLDAGHIIGSAIVELRIEEQGGEKVLLFSGDLGGGAAALLDRPEHPTQADAVLLESTYGDRDHKSIGDTVKELAETLALAAQDHGMVLIPAFAVGRTQELLYWLGQLHQDGLLKQQAVYLDSPMAIAATEIYDRHHRGRRRGAAQNLAAWLPLLHYVHSPEESMALNRIGGGAIIIAGSGMCTGGRIRHHLKHRLWHRDTHVIITGYQARGTLGRRLVDGEKHLRLLAADIAVKATIHTLGGFSAHAGQTQLLQWISGFTSSRPDVYLVHGEESPLAILKNKIEASLSLNVRTAKPADTIAV